MEEQKNCCFCNKKKLISKLEYSAEGDFYSCKDDAACNQMAILKRQKAIGDFRNRLFGK